jgi:uncharacterized protein YuzE
VRVTYDKEADAAYIYFDVEGKVESTQGDWPFNVDINSDGEVLGFEIMDASKVMSPEYLSNHSK